jgi:hypothetical protein
VLKKNLYEFPSDKKEKQVRVLQGKPLKPEIVLPRAEGKVKEHATRRDHIGPEPRQVDRPKKKQVRFDDEKQRGAIKIAGNAVIHRSEQVTTHTQKRRKERARHEPDADPRQAHMDERPDPRKAQNESQIRDPREAQMRMKFADPREAHMPGRPDLRIEQTYHVEPLVATSMEGLIQAFHAYMKRQVIDGKIEFIDAARKPGLDKDEQAVEVLNHILRDKISMQFRLKHHFHTSSKSATIQKVIRNIKGRFLVSGTTKFTSILPVGIEEGARYFMVDRLHGIPAELGAGVSWSRLRGAKLWKLEPYQSGKTDLKAKSRFVVQAKKPKITTKKLSVKEENYYRNAANALNILLDYGIVTLQELARFPVQSNPVEVLNEWLQDRGLKLVSSNSKKHTTDLKGDDYIMVLPSGLAVLKKIGKLYFVAFSSRNIQQVNTETLPWSKFSGTPLYHMSTMKEGTGVFALRRRPSEAKVRKGTLGIKEKGAVVNVY